MQRPPTNDFDRYHAHVYFDAESEELARELCLLAWTDCHLGLGRFHQKPIGPHPLSSCQLSFDANEFDRVVALLNERRNGLSVLVHPITGDALAEHTTHARWLGDPVQLNIEIFEKSS